jgi:hypothetical protein
VEALSVGEDRDLPRNISAPVLVEIPYGVRAKAPALAEALRPIVHCDSVSGFLPVVFSEQWADRDWRLTLELLLIAALLISGATTARELWCSGRQGEKALRKATNGS